MSAEQLDDRRCKVRETISYFGEPYEVCLDARSDIEGTRAVYVNGEYVCDLWCLVTRSRHYRRETWYIYGSEFGPRRPENCWGNAARAAIAIYRQRQQASRQSA